MLPLRVECCVSRRKRRRSGGHITVVDATSTRREAFRIVGSADNIRMPRTEILESPAGFKRPPQKRSAMYWELSPPRRGSQFYSEWWQFGAPLRTKLRTHTQLKLLVIFPTPNGS